LPCCCDTRLRLRQVVRRHHSVFVSRAQAKKTPSKYLKRIAVLACMGRL
jgi:hypothetical protein